MNDQVVLLGTKGGPAIRTGSTMPTSSLLQLDGEMIVVDCGLGVTRGLVDQGIALKDLTTVFITHLHSDHYLELGPMLHTAWTAGLKTPVVVWGPDGLATYWDNFVLSMIADIDLRIVDEGRPDLRDLVEIKVMEEGAFAAVGPLWVTALRVDHPPLVDCFALSVQGQSKRVCFSADTAYFPPLVDFARDADLLIHEAMLPDAVDALVARVGNGDDRLLTHLKRSHTAASDAARIAQGAGVKALALHHLLPSDDPDFGREHWEAAVRPIWSGPFHLGTDGLVIPL